MRLQELSRNSAILSLKKEFYSGEIQNNQASPKIKLCGEEFFSKLLDRRWTMLSPDTKIHQIMVSGTQRQHEGGPVGNVSFLNNTHPSLGDSMMVKNNLQPSFYIVRDDLLHPLINGNKARKLDALLPLIEDHLVTDVVTCGGCQSAHAAAVAVSCAERALKSHLLLRGEQPEISTGYNLISTIYGNVTYVPRSFYAKRDEMMTRHAELVAGSSHSILWLSDIFEASFVTPISNQEHCLKMNAHRCAEKSKKVVIVSEGAADVVGLLGVIRLVQYLSQNQIFGKEQALKIIVDSGTGTTAIGLGLGAICLGLPWEVVGVMLADTADGYKKQEKNLISEFQRCCACTLTDHILGRVDGGVVHWVERSSPRKFGNVLTGEVKACQQIAQQTGVLVDPIYTLAAWELASQFSQEEANGGAKVVMLHTGGTLGMFGIAQRYKSFFNMLKDRVPG